jgi:hypothetical protein
LVTVCPNIPGAGRPASTYSVPPLVSTMFTLWLPPNVWLHGSQSTISGRSAARNGHARRIIAWFAASIWWVFSTPLGAPVDPEVNKILAMVSAVTAPNARATAPAGRTAVNSSGQVRAGTWPVLEHAEWS